MSENVPLIAPAEGGAPAGYPVMTFGCDSGVLNRAFRIALGDLFSSTILYRSGLVETPAPMIMAGLDYEEPWTRDAAINSWNAGSLLNPGVARNTLLGVLERKGGAAEIGGQYWDKIIWVTAAWHHYLVTGDREFLELAARTSICTLSALERNEFDRGVGLFRGGACFQDGVAGYPERYARGHCSGGPVTRWVEANPLEKYPVGAGLPMMAGSTNCLYYAAYRCLARMQAALGLPGTGENEAKAEALKAAILAQFWDSASGRLAYLIDPWEICRAQEGLGLSFALLFGILQGEDARRAIGAQHLTPHGIPCVWPTFPRYETPDGRGVGRHSGTVWPHVQGFWAEAVAQQGCPQVFLNELVALAGNATRDAQFTEIYHPETGAIYGGRQEEEGTGAIVEWASCRRQTWSATAFLRMILHGLVGMRFEARGVAWNPTLGNSVSQVHLRGLPYRRACLDIRITGSGTQIKTYRRNGKIEELALLPADASGAQSIEIELAP